MKHSLPFIYLLSTASILCALTLLNWHTAVAVQNGAYMALPEGAKARLGKGGIRELAYTPNGNHLLVASSIGIWTYDAHTTEELDLLNTHLSHGATAFSPNRRLFVGARGDDEETAIYLWDLAKGQNITTLKGHTRYIYSIAFSPDGKTLATVSGDSTVRLWDVATGEHKMTLVGHTESTTSVAFSPDGKTLTTGSWDGTVRLWETATGDYKTTLTEHSDGIRTVVFSPDGRTLAIVPYNTEEIQLWDVAIEKQKQTLRTERNISCIAFHPDSQTLASGGWSELYLWDVDTGKRKAALTGHLEEIASLTFSPDGKTLASGSPDELYLWDSTSGAQTGRITGHTQEIWGFALSPDGRTIATGNRKKIRLWDTVNRLQKSILYDDSGNYSLAFSPDGKTLANGISGNIRLWDLATGTHKHLLKAYLGNSVGGSGIQAIVFSPDGRFFANGHTGEPTVWLWYAGFIRKHIFIGHTDRISALAFSPDSRTLASGSLDQTIRLWDVETNAHQITLTGHTEPVESVAFSPDGEILASASRDGTVRLWESRSGALKATFTEYTESLVFSPDGKTLATGGDSTVQLRDVATGIPKAIFTGHTSRVSYVVFSPDGKTLISASYDGTILLWNLNPEIETVTQVEDVNRDGVLNSDDLVFIASRFGQSGVNEADVNADGTVDIVDLVLVAAALEACNYASPLFLSSIPLTFAEVHRWLIKAQGIDTTMPPLQRGITVLRNLLGALSPKETVLLPNYPNPFNPETWIPYQLATSANVTVRIYTASGGLVRTLSIGYQPAGIYQSRNCAAYWDGKNDIGEQVASGTYFYTLSAGENASTRKMVIRK